MLTLIAPDAPTTDETALDTPPAIPATRGHVQGLPLCSDVCPLTRGDCPTDQSRIDTCPSC
jgi:hypothetical protein